MSAVHHRSKLTASQQACHALIRRRHEEKLGILRRSIEDDPHSGLTSRLSRAEHQLMHGDLAGCGDTMIEIDQALNHRAEQRATDAAIAQTVTIAKARSETVEQDGAALRPTAIRILNRDGLLWLKAKKRLPSAELAALERYRALFDKVHSGPTADSTQAVERGPPKGSGADGSADLSRVQAIWELDEAREAVGHDEALLWLLNEVAGKGSTLRDLANGDERQAGKLETELRVAARLLAKRFRMRG